MKPTKSYSGFIDQKKNHHESCIHEIDGCPKNRILSRVFAFILIVGMSIGQLQAMPASPLPFTDTQPDGTEITLYIRGDEKFHYYEADGYTVLREANGSYVYATLDANGSLATTASQVGKSDPQAAGLQKGTLPAPAVIAETRGAALAMGPGAQSGPAPVDASGTVKNIVILMRFSDHTGRTLPTVSNVDKLMNAVGGDATYAPTGSVRDVYLENSYGSFTLDSTVFAWVTLPQTEAFYAGGGSGLNTGFHQAIRDALTAADPLIDFSQFDGDSNNYVDAITFLHSGYAAEFGGTDAYGATGANRIWSHRWSIYTGQFTSAEGIKVNDYHISPAVWGTSGTAIGRIGVICHETGHFFGLPDLYDGSGGSGIGSWGMMANSWGFDNSQWYPPHFCGWSKVDLGWITPTVITDSGTYTVPQLESPGAKVFKIAEHYASDEYLLIENRQAVGTDQKIPSGTGGKGGLAIFHLDDQASYTQEGFPGQAGWPANGNHYRVALLQADGNYNLEQGQGRGDGNDVYRSGHVTEIFPGTVPNIQGYQGGTITTPPYLIDNISATGTNMTFRFTHVEVPDMTSATDSGTSNSDDLTKDTTPTFTGTGRPGATLQVNSDATGNIGSTTVPGSGNWTYTPSSALAVQQQGIFASSDGVSTGNLTVTIDNVPPPTPSGLDLHVSSDSGPSSTDNVTNDNTPLISGNGSENGVDIQLHGNNEGFGTISGTGGAWSGSLTTIPDGPVTIFAYAIDAAGNDSGNSVGLPITIDTAAPTATINQDGSQADPASGGPVNFDVSFNEDIFGFAGTDISLGGTAGATTANISGGPRNFDISISGTTREGSVIATLGSGRATDLAGNGNGTATTSDNSVDIDIYGGTPLDATPFSFSNSSIYVPGALFAGDMDFFEFTLTEAAAITLGTMGSTNTFGSLFDMDNNLLNDPVADDDAGTGGNASSSAFLRAGTYKVEIKGGTGSESGAYDLLIDIDRLLNLQPDLRVGKTFSSTRGNGIYNLSGGGQTFTQISKKLKTITFHGKVENDGDAPDDITLRGTRKNSKFGVKYFDTLGNATAAMYAGTRVLSLGAGSSSPTRIQVKPSKRLKNRRTRKIKRTSFKAVVSGRSSLNPAIADVTKGVTKTK